MSGASYTRRYARHLLLTEIGEAGQARLCATRVRVPGTTDARAASIALEYLERAGLRVVAADAAVQSQDHPAVDLACLDTRALRELAGRDELEPAAAALAGAFAAVEAIKAALAVGTRAALPRGLTLAAEVRS